MFSQLCLRYPRRGGPYVYVNEAFGRAAGFFTGWTYWVISWVSTIAIVTSAVGYMLPFVGHGGDYYPIALEILIITCITLINLRGVYSAGSSSFLLTAIKMIPFIVVPVLALQYFDADNLVAFVNPHEEHSNPFNSVILLTFWGFIGFESITATAGDIENPTRTIPKAIILGTLCVAAIYFLSTVGIMGAVPVDVLTQSHAPYADTIQYLLGGYWHIAIVIIAAVMCVAAVNAWTLASGQIALSIAQEKMLPKWFAKTNKHGAPVFALIISCAGTIPLIILTHNESIAHKVNTIIDFSVTDFVFVYIVSCAAFLKLLWQNRRQEPTWLWFCGVLSMMFCAWILYSTPFDVVLVASLFVLSGLPMYLIYRKKGKQVDSLESQIAIS
jgi:APA family basic amino acid/polyamine antiporter